MCIRDSVLRTGGAEVREFDDELLDEGHRQGDAGAGTSERADPAVVDDGLHLGVARGHAGGGGEVDRGRVQLLVRGYFAVFGGVLQ